MTRKKILWLCSWYPDKIDPFDGDFIQRHAKAAAFYNDIHVIHLVKDEAGVITENIKEEIKQEPGLTEQIIYFKKPLSVFGKFGTAFKWMKIFKKAIKQFIQENGKPDLVHVHIPIKAGIMALWIKKKYKIPFVVTEHWGIYNDVEVENYSKKSSIVKSYTKRIIKEAATFLSVSDYLGKGVNYLVTQKPFEVIANVTNTQLFFYKEYQTQKFRFIHVSNMVPLKNVEGILRGAKLLAEKGEEFELILAGNRDATMSKYAKDLGLLNKTVFFRGEISYEAVANEMQHANALILFSNIENSPCVIGEALCCGLPVIATSVGGIPELVSQKNSALLKPGNVQALADAMQQIINNYTEFDRRKIAEDAQQKFSYAVIGKKLDEVYKSVLN